MTEFNRRTIVKAAGASLLGATITGTTSGKSPSNAGVSLLEVWLSFDFRNEKNIELSRSNGPSKYGIDPEEGVLDVRTVRDEEANVLGTKERVVNFHGIKSDIESIGGETVNTLFLRDSIEATRTIYTYSEEGYDMPSFDVNWNATALSQLLSADEIQDREVTDDFMEVRLSSQEVTIQKKIVRDELVEDDDVPEWQRSKKIDYLKVAVEVDPYLTIAFHPDLNIVGLD